MVESSEVVQLVRPRAGHFDLGTGYHGDLWLDLDALFLRPARGWAEHTTPIRELYLCGAGTHPGGGVTGANGRNAARVILRHAKRGRV